MSSLGRTTPASPRYCGSWESCWFILSHCRPKLIRQNPPQWRLTIESSTGDESAEGSWPSDVRSLTPIFEKVGPTFYVPAQRHQTHFRSAGPFVEQDIEARIDEEIDVLLQDASPIIKRLGLETVRRELRLSLNERDAPELTKRRKLMLVGSSLVNDKIMKQRIINLDYGCL